MRIVFAARIMVLAEEITVTRHGKSRGLHAGDHCEFPADRSRRPRYVPEGEAFIAGKAYRPQR